MYSSLIQFGADREASGGQSVAFSPFTPTTGVTAEGYQQQ